MRAKKRRPRIGSLALLAPLACFLGFPPAAASAPPEPADVYELTATAALERVPIQFRSLFEPHRQAILACAAGRGAGRFAPSPALARPEGHYLMLDAAAADASPPARLKAARSFPHEQGPAAKLFAAHGQREGGTLPWVLAEQCEALTSAIRQRNEAETARLAGVVIHLAADACLPFNTTTQPLGPTFGQFVLPPDDAHEVIDDCAHARGRAQDSLIRRHRSVLAERLSQSERLCQPVEDVIEEAFRHLTQASAALDQLLEIDTALVRRWDLRDGEAFAAIAEEYLEELDRDATPLIAHRLDAAACFAAGLLVRSSAAAMGETPPAAATPTASTAKPGSDAGSAGSSTAPPSAAPASAGSSAAAPASSTAVRFVGSKNSTKFHRPTCRSAQNIKEDNRVNFATAAAAIAAGRQPCSTCDPRD